MNGSNIIISTIKQIVQDKIHAILILKADNNYDNIVQVGLYYDTRMVIASVHDSKDMKEHLIYLIKCAERLIVFDLKDLSKNFLSSDEHAKVLFENNEMSLRRVAKWVTERTGRYISHVGLYKIFNKSNNKKIKNTIFPQTRGKKIEPKVTINKVDSSNIRLTIDINIR